MNQLVTTFTAATLVGLIYAFTNFLRNLTNLDLPGSRSAVVHQVIAWVAAIGALFLCAQADLAKGLVLVGAIPLGKLDGWSLVLLGLTYGGSAAVLRDLFKSRDAGTTVATPSFLRNRNATPPEV
jgi:hypothetical protein